MRKLKVLFVFIGALSISLAPAQTFQKMTIEKMFEFVCSVWRKRKPDRQ